MITKKDLNNLEGLFLLTAVAQTSGKRQAAQALNTSVDTINKYLSDFENEMGTKLLNTNSRGSNLTPNGKKMLEHAHKIKMILENIYSERPSKTEIKGQVRVGIMLDISSVLLIDGLNDLFAHYPELTIVSISNNENLNGDMSYEVGLAFEKPTRNDNVILYTKELKYGFFASAEYLARYGYPVDFEDMLNNFRLIVKVDNNGNPDRFKDLFNRAKHISYVGNTSFAINEVIRHGGGIGVLPLHFKDQGFVCLDNIPCDISMTIYLFSTLALKDVPRVRTVINYYKELLDKL